MTIPLLPATGFPALNVVITALSAGALILLSTLIFTECRFWLQSRGNAGRFQGREPLTLPYSIPWLAGFSRMMDPHAMYRYAMNKSPNQRPVRLRVGPIGIYILFGEKNIKMIFRNSKVLSKDASTQMIFKNTGMPQKDRDIFAKDTSGVGSTPTIDIPEDQRIWKQTHDIGHTHLASGRMVTILTNRFLDCFLEELNKEPIKETSTVRLHDYFKRVMFKASMASIAGTEISRLNPDLVSTYWDFDDTFLLMAIGMPRIVYRKGHVARDRMLAATEKWIKSAHRNFDEKDRESDWEKNFGSRFIREEMMAMEKVGISQEGQAASIMTMVWAINSNAIPCAIWIIFEALQNPGLLQTLRKELRPVASYSDTGDISIDVPRLLAECPLLTSMYLESMRTKTSSTITRQLTEDLECDGYILRKGSHIMSPSWLPQYGPVWDVPGHPASEYWPERFIEMPKMKPENPDEKSQYELAMKPDNFFPYGGGNMICTGRFFAKQEILAAAALMILKFDIQPVDWVSLDGKKKSDRKPKPDESYAGSGILPPDRDLKVKLTRIG